MAITIHSNDPEELGETLSKEALPVVFRPLTIESSFDFTWNGIVLGDIVLASGNSSSGFEARSTGTPGRYCIIDFMQAGQMSYQRGRRQVTGRGGQAFFLPEMTAGRFVAIENSIDTSVQVPLDKLLPVIGEYTADPFESLRLGADVLDITSGNGRLLFSIVQSLQTALSDPLLAERAPLALALMRETLLRSIAELWPRSEANIALQAVAPPNFRRAVDYIHAHLAEPIRVADIAATAGCDVRALQHSFQRQLGMTPLDYVLSARMQRVHAELLDAPDVSIESIAHRWGFVHMGHFGTRYRALYGETPSQTRQSARRA